MTLLSYISIPYTSQSNETNYIRIDLMTNKVFVKDNEVLNIEDCKKDEIMHDCIECCDHDHDNGDYHDHDSDCCINDQKDELIALLKNELETEEEKGDNKDYILELKVTLERLQM